MRYLLLMRCRIYVSAAYFSLCASLKRITGGSSRKGKPVVEKLRKRARLSWLQNIGSQMGAAGKDK